MKTKGNFKVQPVSQAIRSIGRRIFMSLISAGVLLFPLFIAGQSDQSNPRFTEGDINDSAQLKFGLPLGEYQGRGIDLPISLSYSSKVWKMEHIGRVQHTTGVTQSVNEAIYSKHAVSGWKSSLALPIIEFPKSNSKYDYKGKSYDYVGGSCFNFRMREVYIHMPDGTTHTLRKNDQPSNNPASVDMSDTFYAVDGSRVRFDANGTADTGTIWMPDGTRYILGHPISKIVDRHNNEITYDETTRIWTDTIGRQIANPLPAAPTVGNVDYYLPGLAGVGNGQLKYTFKWNLLESTLTPDESGNPPALKVVGSEALPNPYSPPSAGNYPATQSSGLGRLFQSTPWIYGPNGPLVSGLIVGKGYYPDQLFNPVVLSEVVLPDGTSYKFTYNTYGELDKIVYPTNAYDRYDYTGYPPSVAPPEDIPGQDREEDQQPYLQSLRWISSRKQSVNGLGNDIREWTYLNSPLLDGGGYTAVIAPDGTKTEIERFGAGPKTAATTGSGGQTIVMIYPFGFKDAKVGMTASKKFYGAPENGGGLLKRELYQYDKSTYNYTIQCTLGSSPISRTYPLSRTPRLTRMTSIVFEGGGDALAQSTTYSYDTTHEMSTGIDQTNAAVYDYVVLSNSYAETADIGSIPVGSILKSTETTFLSDPIYRGSNILSLETVEKIKDASNTVVSQTETLYDETNYSPAVGRALPTSEKVWLNSIVAPNSYVIERTKYDFYGNVIEETDARGNTTTKTYDSAYNAFVVKEKTPIADPTGLSGSNIAFETNNLYDPTSGLLLSVTDINGQTTSFEYNDPFLRKKKAIGPNGHQTISEYGLFNSDAARWINTKTQVDAYNWEETKAWYDGLGRIYKVEKTGPGGNSISETEFDEMGRVKRSTYPFRIGETESWTTRTYDDLGRITKIASPDNSEAITLYALAVTGAQIGQTSTTTNEAGNLKRSVTNALDQLVRVDEPDATGSLGAINNPNRPTYYTYNALGKLTKVTQGSQNRFFLYDSAGRLLRVRQPEQTVNLGLDTSGNPENNQWTAGFTYDDNDNLLTSTDAKGTTITYTYDHLDRILSRSYSESTPTVNHKYDNLPYGNGKLIEVSNSISTSKTGSFDQFGRVSSYQQITDGEIYTSTFQYDLAGKIVSETYPSGRRINYDHSNSGSLSRVWSEVGSNSKTYANSFSYTASKVVEQVRLGNGLWETFHYNNRVQPVRIAVGRGPVSTDIFRLDNEFGKLNSNATVDTAKNNGNIAKQTLTIQGMTNQILQKYKYDALDRLVEAREVAGTNTNWTQNFDYDRFSNRTSFVQVIGSQQISTTPQIDAGTNRFSTGQGYVYDLTGNLIQDAEGRQFSFNGENKQVQVKNSQNDVLGTYYYDGEGKRIKKVTPTETTIFVYSGEKLIAEYSTALAPKPATSYITTDNLGSTRVVTDGFGQIISRHDFMPYGEELMAGVGERTSSGKYGVDDTVRKKFTGYQKDTETGLSFAEARMYEPRHGRFTAVDPLLASGKSGDPQSFNRYAYVLNNPLKFTDPSGLLPVSHWVEQCPGGCWSDTPKQKDKTATNSREETQKSIDDMLAYAQSFDGASATDGKVWSCPKCPARRPPPRGSGNRTPRRLPTNVRPRGNRPPGGGQPRPFGPGLNEAQQRQDREASLKNLTLVPLLGPPNHIRWPGGYHKHHIFPQAGEFAPHFRRAGINIHDFTLQIPSSQHRFIHSNLGAQWNSQWREFFRQNPNATRDQIIQHGNTMIQQAMINGRMVPYSTPNPIMVPN